MMKFTNDQDLSSAAAKYDLEGWYVQDSRGNYLGVLRGVDGAWYVGKFPVEVTPFPITVDRIPR